ncbi:MAG: YihA family ribosome biogenesis GTP-binding protein [Bacteroidales bacterium]|nr:YihA family ribosome biogenesis GTP-binding protein [Bacteroidales bacterium]
MIITDATFAGSSTRVSQRTSSGLPEFAFIGRSNVGKSSLINMLTGRRGLAKTSSTPGKTQLVNHFLINKEWYLVDLPGYGYAKMGKKGRAELSNIIDDYILNSKEMVLLFVLIDSRHDIQQNDMDFLSSLGENGIPFAIIFTKCDKLSQTAFNAQLERNKGQLSELWDPLPDMLSSSSENGKGKDEILNYIDNLIKSLE